MKCKICNKCNKRIFNAIILNKYDVEYFYCDSCGFLQIQEPYWLREAYKSPIIVTDTGIIKRNFSFSRISSSVIFFFFNKKEKFLDFAGGYGILTRIMRDTGFDFYWYDKYCDNLFARGYEFENLKNKKIELITSFECFEHFVDPIQEIEEMLEISSNIFFSTLLLPNFVPNPDNWWYYGFENGQHISFYSLRTLNIIASKYNLFLYSDGHNFHLITNKKISSIAFKALTKLSYHGLFFFIKYFLTSKTFDDFNYQKEVYKYNIKSER